MLTIKAEIQKDKKRNDGTYNVKIRFTLGKTVKRISTIFYVTPKDLTETFQIKDSCKLKFEIDKVVNEYRQKCNELDFERKGLSLDEIMAYLKNDQGIHKPIDFIRFCQNWIKKTVVIVGVTSIGVSAFEGCSSLAVFHCFNKTPPTIESYKRPSFSKYGKKTTLYVPERCGIKYNSSDWGYYFENIIEME